VTGTVPRRGLTEQGVAWLEAEHDRYVSLQADFDRYRQQLAEQGRLRRLMAWVAGGGRRAVAAVRSIQGGSMRRPPEASRQGRLVR
jgi:hypothetical protein